MKLDLRARDIRVTYVYKGITRSFLSNLQLDLGGRAATSIIGGAVKPEEAVFVDISWSNSRLWHRIGIDTNISTNTDIDINTLTNANANIYPNTGQNTDSISTPTWQ